MLKSQGQTLHWKPVEKSQDFRPLDRASGWTARQNRLFSRKAGYLQELLGYADAGATSQGWLGQWLARIDDLRAKGRSPSWASRPSRGKRSNCPTTTPMCCRSGGRRRTRFFVADAASVGCRCWQHRQLYVANAGSGCAAAGGVPSDERMRIASISIRAARTISTTPTHGTGSVGTIHWPSGPRNPWQRHRAPGPRCSSRTSTRSAGR